MDGVHHLPVSPHKLLDIHFRLLREDLLAPLRTGILSFFDQGIEAINKVDCSRRIANQSNMRENSISPQMEEMISKVSSLKFAFVR